MGFRLELGKAYSWPTIERGPVTHVEAIGVDRRTQRLQTQALPQNHSSRDRGNQLKVNPIAGNKYGNRR